MIRTLCSRLRFKSSSKPPDLPSFDAFVKNMLESQQFEEISKSDVFKNIDTSSIDESVQEFIQQNNVTLFQSSDPQNATSQQGPSSEDPKSNVPSFNEFQKHMMSNPQVQQLFQSALGVEGNGSNSALTPDQMANLVNKVIQNDSDGINQSFSTRQVDPQEFFRSLHDSQAIQQDLKDHGLDTTLNDTSTPNAEILTNSTHNSDFKSLSDTHPSTAPSLDSLSKKLQELDSQVAELEKTR